MFSMCSFNFNNMLNAYSIRKLYMSKVTRVASISSWINSLLTLAYHIMSHAHIPTDKTYCWMQAPSHCWNWSYTFSSCMCSILFLEWCFLYSLLPH
jgi:hypothetical protein